MHLNWMLNWLRGYRMYVFIEMQIQQIMLITKRQKFSFFLLRFGASLVSYFHLPGETSFLVCR